MKRLSFKTLHLYFFGALLCGASLTCSVVLWAGEHQNFYAMILAGVIAGSLESCKFIFFPIAAQLWQQDKAKGFALYCLSGCLLVLSIFATVAFFETGSNATVKQAVTSSAMYQILSDDVKSLERQIDTMNQLLNADLKHDFRARAYNQNKQLDVLNLKKEAAITRLTNLRVEPINGIHSMFNAIANTFNANVETVRHVVYVIAAIFMDVCGIACLMLLVTTPYEIKKTSKATADKAAKKVIVNDSNIEFIEQNIRDGVYGCKPVMRNIVKAESVSYKPLRVLFDKLIAEGVLIELAGKKGFQMAHIND